MQSFFFQTPQTKDSVPEARKNSQSAAMGYREKPTGDPKRHVEYSEKYEEPPNKSRGGRKARSKFDERSRQETANTRKFGACLRCRPMKERCVRSRGPHRPCDRCVALNRNSKKTIHDVECKPYKLTDCQLHRDRNLGLTRRWRDMEVVDIMDRPEPTDVRTITWTQDACELCEEPIQATVVRFHPRKGDELSKYWNHEEKGKAVLLRHELAPYCFFDVKQTAAELEHYVERNAAKAFRRFVSRQEQREEHRKSASETVIDRTHRELLTYIEQLEGIPQKSKERELLQDLLKLWFSLRLSTGSAFICGSETLGMKPYDGHESCPWYGRIPIPRMIVAQSDSIRHSLFQKNLGRSFMARLDALILKKPADHWLTIYFCFFVLLGEASFLSEDRYRHAKDNGKLQSRCPALLAVEGIHHSCQVILSYWHYINPRRWPEHVEGLERQAISLSFLSTNIYEFIMDTVHDKEVRHHLDCRKHEEQARKTNGNNDGSPEISLLSWKPPDWTHCFYWICQLFEHGWKEHETLKT